MSIKNILQHNDRAFLEAVKKHGDIMVRSGSYDHYKVRKAEVLKTAEDTKIKYIITDRIFRNKRDVMVIL